MRGQEWMHRAKRFAIVGFSNFFVEILVFNIALFVFMGSVITAKIIGSLIAIINAYLLNKFWVFRHKRKDKKLKEVSLFFMVNMVCMVLSVALLSWFMTAQGVFDYLASINIPEPTTLNLLNFASIVVVMGVRYWMYSSVIFRQPSIQH